MVIDLIVTASDDGYTAEVPSLKECESWAHTEDEVIEKVLELVRYYTNLPEENEILVDRARKQKNKTIFKLVFDKDKK
ncbi:MAG: hypothetical protein JEY94_00890 [Melioribacteraceae bacterium]|nr:hypothetical protein [Melioribacteraceae bacterium]